jgi:hypothetical protein
MQPNETNPDSIISEIIPFAERLKLHSEILVILSELGDPPPGTGGTIPPSDVINPRLGELLKAINDLKL